MNTLAKISVFIILNLTFAICLAQEFPLDTLLWNGAISNRINLVILPDGYPPEEMQKFRLDAQNMISSLFQTPPLDDYQSYFNAFAIEVPSKEKGANHPGTATDVTEPKHPVIEVDNYFGSTYDFGGIHRLLVPTNSLNLNLVLASNFPSYDQAFVIVNSPYYGGSGGPFATASSGESSTEIAIHEIGHSFSGLADEYWAGEQYAREADNMTQETNPEKVRWNPWINHSDVGIYPYGNSGVQALWFRPHQACKMRVLNAPFCAVCTEAFINRIYDLVFPLENYSYPEGTINADQENITFASDFLQTTKLTNYLEWNLNDEKFNSSEPEITITKEILLPGANSLTLTFYDTTSLSKSYLPNSGYIFQLNWTIQNQINTNITYTSAGLPGKFSYRLFPNPIQSQFVLEYQNHLGINSLTIEIYDYRKRKIWATESFINPGENQIAVDNLDLDPGNYILRLSHEKFQSSIQFTKL